MSVAHSNARQQRLQSLRSDFALKEQELREVRARLADLEGSKPAATVDFLTQACKSQKVLDQVPLAQIGNTTSLFRTATAEEQEKQKLLKRTMTEIELQLKHATVAKAKAQKEFERIAAKTGFTESKLAPASKANAGDIPEQDEFEMKQTISAMTKDIAVAQSIIRRKGLTIAKLADELEQRRDKQLVVEQEINKMLVVQRKINERKEHLHAILTRHAELDGELEQAQDAIDQETAALLQLDVAAYKQRSAQVVEGRRAEDRVLKAQEARVLQLDERLKMVRTVLDAHGLLGPVEAVVHDLCSTADHRRSASQKHHHQDPSAAIEPSAEDGAAPAAEAPEPTIDEIVARYSNIETLAPDYETLPASILSVFQHDLQQHERNLRLKSVMVQEKEDTKLALIAKVKDLQVQHEGTVDRVHELKELNEDAIDDRVDSARGVLAQKKEEFDELLRQNARLTKQIRVLQGGGATAAPSRSPSQAPADEDTAENSASKGNASSKEESAPVEEEKKTAKKPAPKKKKKDDDDAVQSGW